MAFSLYCVLTVLPGKKTNELTYYPTIADVVDALEHAHDERLARVHVYRDSWLRATPDKPFVCEILNGYSCDKSDVVTDEVIRRLEKRLGRKIERAEG